MRWDQRPSVLVGLIGSGIQASRTPAMHEREGAEQGLRLVYRRIDLEVLGLAASALPDLLSAAEWMGFAGLNITFPCKQAVIPLLHELSEEALALGAVNSVVLRDGRRVGHNTDCAGFAEAFRRGLPGAPREHVLVLGAGGAGAAVAHALLTEEVERLSITDAEASRAEALTESLVARFGVGRARAVPHAASVMAAVDGLVNCTPVGMAKHPGMPLPAALLRPDIWVADVVYFPFETELLRSARALGCRSLDGGGMAVFQAVGAFRLFTGKAPDAERMLRHFREMTGV
nr:shikimate dehydrogenase [Neoroseomonas alba]